MYEERRYRRFFKGIHLKFFNVCVKETDLCIGAQRELYEEALQSVELYRSQLLGYIRSHPDFLTSLVPISVSQDAPYMIQRMCEASAQAGVGPMAAVAGAVSELVGRDLMKYSGEVIVENGGDIFIKTDTCRKVGIYAGKSPLSERIALEIFPEQTPAGICTSSGTVGHSLSFGEADAAVIIARDTFLADAVATATGNRVKTAEDIEQALNFALSIDGVSGAVVIVGDKIGILGDVQLTAF